jgi:peptide deformylase
MIDLSNLKLITGKEPILMKPAEKFDFNSPPCDPWDLAEAMVKIMIDNNGMGLSACQVGLPYAVFAMIGQPNHVMFNPRLVDVSNETITLDEGCLSFPGVVAPIARARHIKIRFTGPDGQTTTKKFTGMSARVVQHEMDHLNGILFFNHLPRLKREQIFKKAAKGKIHVKSQNDSFFTPLELAANELARQRKVSRQG